MQPFHYQRADSLEGAVIETANGRLAPHQLIRGSTAWPDPDLPRTHTLKVKRDQVRKWAVVEATLPVSEGA